MGKYTKRASCYISIVGAFLNPTNLESVSNRVISFQFYFTRPPKNPGCRLLPAGAPEQMLHAIITLHPFKTPLAAASKQKYQWESCVKYTGSTNWHISGIWQALIGRNLTKYPGTAPQTFCCSDWSQYRWCYFSFLLERYLIRPSRHVNWDEWSNPLSPLIKEVGQEGWRKLGFFLHWTGFLLQAKSSNYGSVCNAKFYW